MLHERSLLLATGRKLLSGSSLVLQDDLRQPHHVGWQAQNADAIKLRLVPRQTVVGPRLTRTHTKRHRVSVRREELRSLNWFSPILTLYCKFITSNAKMLKPILTNFVLKLIDWGSFLK